MNIYDDYSDDAVGKALIERTISSYYDDELEIVRPYKFAYCENLSFFSCSKLSWIGSSAFQGCSNLSSFIFPESICVQIETAAFREAGLREVSACALFAGYDTFQSCQNLKNVTISISRASTQYQSFPIYSIPHRTFDGCINLESFNATYNGQISFAGYGAECFRSCQKLVLGNEYFQNVTGEISANAFRFCKSLSCVISISNSFYLQGGYIFADTGIAGVNMPKAQVSTYMSSQASSIFAGCSNMSFAYMDELSIVYPYMFAECINLESVRFNSITGISYGGFFHCSKLSIFVAPPTLLSIYTYAFSGCSNLRLFVASPSLSYISYAFEGVHSQFMIILKYSDVIPVGFTSGVGLFGFEKYSSWKDRRIYVPDSLYEAYLGYSSWGGIYSSILYSFSDLPSEYSSYLT